MRDYKGYKTFAHNATSDRKERNANYRDNGQGEGYLLGKYFNAEVGAIDEEVKRLGLELNALAQHMGITPDERNSKQLNSLFPTGHILTMATDDIPSGYLACDGSVLDMSLYTNLFGVLGYTYTIHPIFRGYRGTYLGSLDMSVFDGEWEATVLGSPMLVKYSSQVNMLSMNYNTAINTSIGAITNPIEEGGFVKMTERIYFENVSGSCSIFLKRSGDNLIMKIGGQSNVGNGEITLTKTKDIFKFTNEFNLPDFRGMFLRGHRTGTATATDPNYSEDWGVKQLDSIEYHYHNYQRGGVGGTNGFPNYGGLNASDFGTSGVAGGKASFETRGVNYAVNYCIKY